MKKIDIYIIQSITVCKSVKIFIGLKKTCLGVLESRRMWQKQWNRFERGRSH